MHRLLALLLLATRLPAQSSEEAIDTPQGRCLIWVTPPGGTTFPRDASYRRCALDRPPALRPGQAMPSGPRFYPGAGSSLHIVVNPDGSVDPGLSRSSTRTQDVDFNEQALATIKRWQFEPGVRGGVPVRSAIDLEINTDSRSSDTVRARLDWSYVPAWEHDMLSGRWISEPPLPPFAAQQDDSVHAAMLRQLSAMGVVHPTRERSYCLASSDTGTSAAARLTRVARVVRRAIPGLNTGECVDTPERIRLLLPRVHHTENGRAVMYITGAQLPRWPTGFEAQAWPRWKGRCLGAVRQRATVPVTCEVSPDVPRAELSKWYDRPRPPSPRARAPSSDREPVNVSVLATMSGAYGIDTLRTRRPRVPRFRDFAQRDSVASQESWFVWSSVRRDSTTYVVHGDLTARSLRITNAQFDRAPETRGPSSHTASPDLPDRFAAFLLGGVGTRPRAPLTLCFGPCVRRYVLEAGTHTLQPHVRFRVASLRDVSRTRDGQLQLRVVVDPVPDGLVPLLAITGPGGRPAGAYLLRNLGNGVFDWHVTYADGDWMTREVLVYLLRR